MPDLLSVVVERWKTGFKGISALEVRHILGISHEDAIAHLRALEANGAIILRECRLGEPSKFSEMSMAGVLIKVPSEWEMVDTLMAFPSRAVLDDAFHKERVDYGEFTNRLHKGASQVQHYFFKRDVLDKYLKHPDRYAVEQHATGGSVSVTTDYYLSISDENREAEGFATVRFGHMKLADGSEALGVIAHDLGELPKADQHQWAAHEIKNPTLDETDKAWTDYIDEQFYAAWRADHTDYIKLLTATLDEINKARGQLFRRTAHPGLSVPGMNTYGEYIAAHKNYTNSSAPTTLLATRSRPSCARKAVRTLTSFIRRVDAPRARGRCSRCSPSVAVSIGHHSRIWPRVARTTPTRFGRRLPTISTIQQSSARM